MVNKTILISGVTGNLGRAVAEKFIDQGYEVYGLADISTPNVEGLSGYFRADLADPESIAPVLKQIKQRIERIDVIVSTVGGYMSGGITDMESEAMMKMFRLNLFSTCNFIIPLFNQMLAQKNGRIFLVGARAGLSARHRAVSVAYGLSKAAIFALAESLNKEGEKLNVVTSVLVPSIIDTPQNRQAMPDSDFNKWVKPERIANVISFYASSDAEILREPVIKVYGNS